MKARLLFMCICVHSRPVRFLHKLPVVLWNNKKGHQPGFAPLMASDLFRNLPEASDGDGYNDPDNNYYGEGRGNSPCEAVEHCQKFQFSAKFQKCKCKLI